MTIDEKNVVIMSGVFGNEFYLKIEGKLIPTHHQVSNYHTMLWIKDPIYRQKTAQAIMLNYIHLIN